MNNSNVYSFHVKQTHFLNNGNVYSMHYKAKFQCAKQANKKKLVDHQPHNSKSNRTTQKYQISQNQI